MVNNFINDTIISNDVLLVLRLKRFRKAFTGYSKLDSIFISTVFLAFIFDLLFM